MKILVLCYEYPPVGGGGGRVARDAARELVARGHEVTVITAGMKYLPREEMPDGVRVLRPQTWRKREDTCSVPEMGMFLACAFLPALLHCRLRKPDVIHAHFAVPTGALAWLLSRITRIPYVLTAHLGDVPGGVPEQTAKMFRALGPLPGMIWKHAAAATGVSSFVCGLARESYGRDVTCIPNGIALDDAPPEPTVVNDPVRLVFAGRFNPQKNLPFLIRCLAELRHHKWFLDMAGDGPDRPEVVRLIKEYGLESRMHLHGWLDGAGVEALLSAADVLVLPSLSEGLPVIGVQALKHGLAIAGARIPGLKDVLLEGRNGLSAPPASQSDFRTMLDHMIGEKHRLLEMRIASRQMAQRFELSGIVDQYESVLAGAAGAA